MFTLAAIFYGDYPDLANKLLTSISNHCYVSDIRLGLNEVAPKTQDIVHKWSLSQMNKVPVTVYQELNNKNVGKYPLMRQMLYDKPLAKRLMWFDDDSYLNAHASWWDNMHVKSQHINIQIGAVHKIMQRNRQFEVIKQQPWYTAKVLNHRHLYTFATGGWWIADSAFLTKWDYPFKALYHNGGDSILGELIRQQDGVITNAKEYVQCHCESCMRSGVIKQMNVVHINVGGRKGRRGIGRTNEYYVWSDGNPDPDLSHQNFQLKVSSYGI